MDSVSSFARDPVLPVDYDGPSDYGGSVEGGNDYLQSSVNGGDLSSAGDDEANDILRGVFGDDYIDDSPPENHHQFQPQQTTERPPEARIYFENEDQRQVQEEQNFSSTMSNYSEHGDQQRPNQNTNIYGNTSTSMYGHHAHQGQNGAVNAQTTQHQQYQSHDRTQGYHPLARSTPRVYQHTFGTDGMFDHQQLQQSQQFTPTNMQYQVQGQITAQQQMIPKEMLQQQQQDPLIVQRQPQEASSDHEMSSAPNQRHRYRLDAESDEIEVINDDGSPSSGLDIPKKRRLDVSDDGQGPPRRQHPAAISYVARNQHIPQWMNAAAAPQHVLPSQFRTAIPSASTGYMAGVTTYNGLQVVSLSRQYKPIMREIPEAHVPTWDLPLPLGIYRMARGPRRFELSLVNVKEFTITGLPTGYDKPPSSLDGLRKTIKEISKDHGTAVYERGKDGGPGRWRIPLGAYSSFYAYLNNDPTIQVKGISQDQLKIASLGKARLEKGHPSVKKLINMGVPKGLANALAPFQRGGVDFVVEKKGRALIADEMGLGKTVQGIASMSVYHEDWPLLVLTPSSARYHWENEFQQWLGRDSRVNNEEQSRMNLGGESDGEDEDEDEVVDESNCMTLLEDSQIHVLTSGKDDILPRRNTMVVICSYGLAPALAASGKMYPGLFRAAIVDESHMLKNMNTKRTKNLVPVLSATKRCVLLSGTPALAKPSELWPQLKVLNTANSGWWEEEDSFYDKYVKNSSALRRAELHAMLTGTVMIRRLKHDILKSLPKKSRGRAIVDVCTPEMKSEFYRCMSILREGKGQLGMLAKEHSILGPGPPEPIEPSLASVEFESAKAAIKAEKDAKYDDRMRQIDYALATSGTTLDSHEREQWRRQAMEMLQRELSVWFDERMHELQKEIPQHEDEEISKKSVLNRMYSLTGKSKIPLVSRMIRKWLNDPTKGKLCVFAHHIFVLDELIRLSELSNQAGSKSMYIRIDGSTSPRERQAHIKKFQTDPSFRIAILGITAAGVAVTLTASSTVWFTELFWTPALMIQAEDRCHRIGQNSRVECLYFVASGTLDDLLWKLLEKKFRDLGEFVEGMEKQKIVVHKTYHGTKDLDAIFGIPVADDEQDTELNFDEDSDEDEGGKDILKLEHDLQQDIEILGREELTMIKAYGDDDDDGAEETILERIKSDSMPGRTEEEAILLSDDEEDSKRAANPTKETREGKKESRNDAFDGESHENANVGPSRAPDGFDIRRPLVSCCAYSVIFEGESYGMKLFVFHGRVVVGQNLNQQYDRPSQYALVVGVNGQALPMLNELDQIMKFMKSCLERGPVEILFVEVPDLIEEFKRMEVERCRMRNLLHDSARSAIVSSSGTADVIELLDDD